MATLLDLINDEPLVRDAVLAGDWEDVTDWITERISEENHACSTIAEAWEVLCDNANHVLDLADMETSTGSIFDLVEAMATRVNQNIAHETAQVELSSLESLVDYAEAEGFDVVNISTYCALGWMPHISEADWVLVNGSIATLHTWQNVEGEPGARYIVRPDWADLWLTLTKDEPDTEKEYADNEPEECHTASRYCRCEECQNNKDDHTYHMGLDND
jgi:hypothetical protein